MKQMYPNALSVAWKMNPADNMQMGGLIDFIQNNAKAQKVFVYQGAKQSSAHINKPPRNDPPYNLLDVNNYSHTERQLVSAVIKTLDFRDHDI